MFVPAAMCQLQTAKCCLDIRTSTNFHQELACISYSFVHKYALKEYYALRSNDLNGNATINEQILDKGRSLTKHVRCPCPIARASILFKIGRVSVDENRSFVNGRVTTIVGVLVGVGTRQETCITQVTHRF